jgi:short-subunit dehydrogenase
MKIIAITGASGGIGRATALAFAKQGAAIGLIARNKAALEEVKAEVESVGGKALVLPCDVSEDGALEAAAQTIEETLGPLDIWINSAMVTVFGKVEDISGEEYRRVTDVTYHGTVLGTMAALKRMKSRNRGHIIQIGSALSYRSIPLQSAYCGAKHAIRGFTDALRSELIHEKSAIELSMIQLPAFNTPQFSWARLHIDKQPQSLPPIHDPNLAAEVVLWTAEHPQREVWVGWPTWQAVLGQKVFPGLLDRYMAKKAWSGQLTDQAPSPDRPDNLFTPADKGYAVKGSLTDKEITEKPKLWQVPNQNFWINSAGFGLIFLGFLLGLLLG